MTIPSDIATFNGATVAELILGKLDPNVDHLIDVLSTKNSNSLESPLLEFKGTWRKPVHDTSPDDYHKWNVVKALVALYNAYGGCVLVGLAEGHPDKTQLKLLDCDPDGIRANPKNEWKDLQSHLFTELFKGEKGQGLFNSSADESYQIPSASLNRLKRHVAAYFCPSQRYGGNVIALIVSPLDSNNEAIYIDHKAKRKNGSEFKETLLYHREHLIAESPSIPESGKPSNPNDWTSYFEERQKVLSSTHFKALLENAPERPIAPSHMEKSIGPKIHTYYEHLAKNFRRLNNIFTPLDAEGEISEDTENDIDIFRPTAQSFFGFDDDLDEQMPSTEDEDGFENDDVFDEDDSDGSEPADADDKVMIVKDLIDLIGENKRLAVIGEPGAGKSTCLCYYALKDWREKTSNPSLNFYLPLARWQEGGCSILGLICNATNCDLNEIQYLVDQNRLHLLLDALNECPDHLRPMAVANIQSFLRQCPSVKITITSRKEEDTHGFKFSTFTVQPMGREQQLKFLGKYLPTNQNTSALLDKILSQPGGDSIAANPMLLGMVADIVKKGGALPHGRATLYQTWLSRWYERECKKAQRAANPLPVESPQEALGLLSRIAFAGRLHGYRDIPIQLVESELQTDELALAKRICEGPLLSIENGTLHFRHETFQEYLCAEHLVRHKDALDHLEKVDYGTWGMPLAYAGELLAKDGKFNPATFPFNAASKTDTWFNILFNLQIPSSPYQILTSNEAFYSISLNVNPEFQKLILPLIPTIIQWPSNTPLKYLISIIPSFRALWESIEINVIKYWLATQSSTKIQQQVRCQLRTGTPRRAFDYLPSEFLAIKDDGRREIISVISSIHHPSWRIFSVILQHKLATPADIRPAVTHFLQDTERFPTGKAIVFLIREGLATKDELKPAIDTYVLNKINSPTSVKALRKIVTAEWSTMEGIRPAINKLIRKAFKSPSACKFNALIKAGFITKDDLINKASKTSSQKIIKALIKARLATENNFVYNNECPLNTTRNSEPEHKQTSIETPPRSQQPSEVKQPVVDNAVTKENEMTPPSTPHPTNRLSELQDDTLREKTVSSLAPHTFEATCIKGYGSFGFLGHPDFENGIYLHKSVTSDCKIEEGQIWRVTVGARFNSKQGTWCYAALTAELISEPTQKQTSLTTQIPAPQPTVIEQPIVDNGTAKENEMTPPSTPHPTYRLSELKNEASRKKKNTALKELFFEAPCIEWVKNYGYLRHPAFEGKIYVDLTDTGKKKIQVGQIWRFTAGVHRLGPRGEWMYRAKKATLVSSVSTKPAKSASKQSSPTSSVFATAPSSKSTPVPAKQNGKAASSVSLTATNHISIYIDETWPGTQDATYKDIGVIGGIAVAGDGWKNQILPAIKTHIRNYDLARKVTKQMLASPGVFPFVLPIKLGKNPAAAYFELVQHAILLLLGWLLPHGEHKTMVDVYLEHITTFKDGHKETDFFNVLQQAMQLLGGNKRFAHWQIRQVKWVPKEFEYVPYADLVCQTCVPHPDQQQFAQDVQVRSWPGFLPFTPGLFPLLRDMDTASTDGFIDLFFKFAQCSLDTPLFKHITQQTIERAKRENLFRDALLNRFEKCYERKDRDIRLLNRLTAPFFSAFPLQAFADSPRMFFLRIFVEIQHANHNGDPESINNLTTDYEAQRKRLLAIDRELCAYGDLNLIVHYHDLFLFEKALQISDSWIEDKFFPALSLVNRGRMLSSRGQSYALLGRHSEADMEFEAAISLFAVEPKLYEREIDQTRVYQAINRLEQDPGQAINVVEKALGDSLTIIASNPATDFSNPFHEHLFLKTLWTLKEDLAPVIHTYLEKSSTWSTTQDYHPYELILFYRALLLHGHDRKAALSIAEQIESLFERMDYGGTLGLIHAYIRVILKRLGIGPATEKQFAEELDVVAYYLPAASVRIATLRQAWDDTSVSIDRILPFNYR